MFKQDLKSNCTIFNGSFFDDIQPYELLETNSDLKIKFDNDNIFDIDFKWNSLIDVISTSLSLIDNPASVIDSWIPIIVQNDNHVVSKEIRNNCTIKKKILGIENFIQFKALFKNWELSNSNIQLNSNWFIHSNDIPYIMDYGILCWYKKHTNYKYDEFKDLSEFPIGSRLLCNRSIQIETQDSSGNSQTFSIETDDILIKHGPNSVVLVDKDDSIITNSTDINNTRAPILFNTERKIFSLPNIIDLQFKLDINSIYTGGTNKPLEHASLWIANGESYSYSLNSNRRAENYSFNIPSLSYLSPSLFYIYNAIYHRLTINSIKGYDSSTILKSKSALLKKLCYFLSTSPTIDRTTVDVLYHPDIQSEITTLLDTTISSQEIEKRAILKCLTNIMKQFTNMSSSLRLHSNLTNNYIHNKQDLFKKITSKYTPHLLINSATNVKYKHIIDYGPNISIRRNIRSVCDKTLMNQEGAVGDDGTWINVIYNNETIKCQGMVLSTKFDRNSSEIILSDEPDDPENPPKSSKILPTADITRSPLGGQRNIDLGPDIKITLTSEDGYIDLSQDPPVEMFEKIFTIELQEEENGNIKDSYYWELVDGPDCLRFSDCVIDPNIFGRCAYTVRSRTSRDTFPVVYIRSRGLYTIRVTATSQFGVNTDTLKIYAVDENNEYAPGLSPPDNVIAVEVEIGNRNFIANFKNSYTYASNLIPSDNLKCLCYNMSQFALSKDNGIFWPLKTDSYVIEAGFDQVQGSTTDFRVPGMVKMEDFLYSGVKVTESESDQKLTFTIEPNNSKVIWENIILEHMRGNDPNVAQCESFFQETLARTKKRATDASMWKGTSGFRRIRRSNDDIILKRFDSGDEQFNATPGSDFDLCNIKYLPVSTLLAPAIKAYGGYDKETLKTIGITGINIFPNHPNIGQNLPDLWQRHYFGFPKDTYCHLRPIHLNNSADIIFDKGVFHHEKGWICSPNSSDNKIRFFSDSSVYNPVKNKDSSFKFKTDSLQTFKFKGLGVYNLRSSTNKTEEGVYVYPNVKTSAIKLQSASDTTWFSNDPLLEHDRTTGYRNINEYGSQEADEYIVDILNSSETSFECGIDTNTIVYGINRADLDDLKIESLEIKINNLNYPNPKHLCVWLEIDRDEPLPNPKNKIHTNFIDLNSITNLELKKYMQNLDTMNSSTNNKKRRLYLLNRDNIDNFVYNFSLKFSDDAEYNTMSDYSSFYNQTDIKNLYINKVDIGSNESVVRPTITANGYSDSGSIQFKEAIIRNKLFNINNTLSKFNSIPIKNTRFTLYIGVYDDYDNLTIRDTTTINNTSLGTISTITRPMPNILSNAICSWDLIIHTNKVNKPIPSDPIGSIDRTSTSPSFNRCNFIANFQDKKHLIPQANLNAPYQYISNVNSCRYKEKEFSTVTRFNSVEFPSWAIPQILAAMTPIYGGGGFVFTGDPSIGYNAIYEFFADLREQAQTEAQTRKIQRGRYTDYGLGQPDKALINISQDGYVWYKLEAPIYRYTNSIILNKNKYQYIKLSNNVFPFLSRFEYSFFDPNDLDFLPVLGDDTNENLKIINDFWKKNNIAGFSSLLTKDIIINNPNKFIKIKGSRAYYLFDQNEVIDISDPSPTDPDNMISFTIAEKGILNLNNQEYTVFYVNSNINIKTYLTKKTTDTIIVFKNNFATKVESNPLNKWGLEKQAATKKIPERHFNTLGEGSYGRGTEFLRESVFTYLEDENKIEPIYNIINHRYQYSFKFNQATIYKPDNSTVPIDIPENATKEQTIRGYPWAFSESEKQIIKNYIIYGQVSAAFADQLAEMARQKAVINSNNIDPNEKIIRLRQVDRQVSLDQVKKMFLPDLKAYYNFIENDAQDCIGNNCLKKTVKGLIDKIESETSIFYNPTNNYTFMDIRCSSFMGDNVPDYGEIVIENDWVIDQPKNKLSDEDINRLTNRINLLQTPTESFIARLAIAKTESNFPNNIGLDELKSLSIPDLMLYLNSLDDDPLACYTKNTYTDAGCRASFTRRIISDRTDELVELSSVVETNNKYNTGILPTVERTIEPKSDGVLSIQEQLNTDYYWIVIDPEQGCSLSKNMTAKVWTQIKQECVANKSTVGGTSIFGDDTAHLCPCPPNQDLKVTSEELDVETRIAYIKIDNLKAEQEKRLYYSNVTEWQKITHSSSNIDWSDKYIWINGGTTDTGYPLLDTLVGIYEEFDIPANAQPNGIHKVKDVININNLDTIKVRFGNIPRKVKEYDRNYKRYVPNFWGKLVKGFPSQGSGGDVWYSYDCWSCFNTQGNYVPLPDQYKMMNEMLFRSYFGSIDGVEHKNSLLSDTKESWEWIPYEYDKAANSDYSETPPIPPLPEEDIL